MEERVCVFVCVNLRGPWPVGDARRVRGLAGGRGARVVQSERPIAPEDAKRCDAM